MMPEVAKNCADGTSRHRLRSLAIQVSCWEISTYRAIAAGTAQHGDVCAAQEGAKNMRARNWLTGLAGALALGCMALSAEAAPIGGAPADLKTTAGQMSNVDQARYRCWWHRGHRHCRWARGYYPYYYGYGGYPYAYPYYGPSFGLYFGGGRGHFRHHRRWR
jgi:hypothetical protein